MSGLAPQQYAFLIDQIKDSRVQQLRGNSHLEAWDIRRHLIRAFGFGGFDIQTKALDLVAQLEHAPTQPNGKPRWTVVYRAEVRLIIKAADGAVLAVYEDGASGDSQNQPSLGDAHDQALKTALSQGLKRCAVNLGDQFGLSLYNDGKTNAVVIRSLVTPEEPDAAATAPLLPVDDAPVLPEPGTAPVADEPAPAVEPPAAVAPAPSVDEDRQRANGVRDWAVKPDRTSDELRDALARLNREHPATAKLLVVNEHGDDELLSVLLQRRLHDTAPAPAATGPAPATPVDDSQHRHMHALWREVGYAGDANRGNRLQIMSKILGRTEDQPLTSSKDLTAAEADQVIAALKERKAAMQRQQPVGANA